MLVAAAALLSFRAAWRTLAWALMLAIGAPFTHASFRSPNLKACWAEGGTGMMPGQLSIRLYLPSLQRGAGQALFRNKRIPSCVERVSSRDDGSGRRGCVQQRRPRLHAVAPACKLSSSHTVAVLDRRHWSASPRQRQGSCRHPSRVASQNPTRAIVADCARRCCKAPSVRVHAGLGGAFSVHSGAFSEGRHCRAFGLWIQAPPHIQLAIQHGSPQVTYEC